eukprot:scaffold66728_cov17-Tisochrysis_lutea.AAC.2
MHPQSQLKCWLIQLVVFEFGKHGMALIILRLSSLALSLLLAQSQQEAWQTFLADMDERINKQKVLKCKTTKT